MDIFKGAWIMYWKELSFKYKRESRFVSSFLYCFSVCLNITNNEPVGSSIKMKPKIGL